MTKPIDTTTIQSQYWSPKLGEAGQAVENADDIDQCIRIILGTPKGSDPHRPEFASNIHNYVDWPLNQITPHLIRETFAAVGRWEPRIELVRVEFDYDRAVNEAQLVLSVFWRLAGGFSPTRATEVILT